MIIIEKDNSGITYSATVKNDTTGEVIISGDGWNNAQEIVDFYAELAENINSIDSKE